MLEFLKSRYDAFAQRVLSSLSEIERRDVRAFDTWFYRSGGWRWLIGVVMLTTLISWIASNFPGTCRSRKRRSCSTSSC
jgi:hypothetical protein